MKKEPNQSSGCVKTVLSKFGNDQFLDMGSDVETSRRIQWSEIEFSHSLSSEPTAVAAAVASHAANRRWLAFVVRRLNML
jgi:hypothetical protein